MLWEGPPKLCSFMQKSTMGLLQTWCFYMPKTFVFKEITINQLPRLQINWKCVGNQVFLEITTFWKPKHDTFCLLTILFLAQKEVNDVLLS